jgi:hypothetical protein
MVNDSSLVMHQQEGFMFAGKLPSSFCCLQLHLVNGTAHLANGDIEL